MAKSKKPANGKNKPSPNPTPGIRKYAEPKFIPLTQAQIDQNITDSDANQYDAYAAMLQPIPPPRHGVSLIKDLAGVLGQEAIDAINKAGKIVFHAVGDTGADKRTRVADEADVATAMAEDLKGANAPSFFYHLGDVVYEFGQAEDYYAQFYEPFCAYNAPIFAIPGNHDGMIWDKSMKSLAAFLDNFCAPAPGPAQNAGSLLRSTMDQPGVYFTLAAPFVNIIGLYSNVADKGAGAISSEGGKNTLADDQKDFLISELKRLKPLRTAKKTAVILAVHHPAYTGDTSGGKPIANTLRDDLDDAFKQGGLWPDAVLCGHSHLYQRYQRKVNGKTIPYLIAGCGGYNLAPYDKASTPGVKIPPGLPANPALQTYIKAFGYLTVEVTSEDLTITFNGTSNGYTAGADSVKVVL